MIKKEIRKKYLDLRRNLTLEDKRSKDQAISKFLFDWIKEKNFDNIHVFAPIEKFLEVDIFDALVLWAKAKPNKQLVIPKVESGSPDMQHYVWSEELIWEKSAWGILEPKAGEIADLNKLQLILTPLVAVDQKGQRVGYGKGYYNRFFHQTPSETFKLGLGYFPPIENIEDVHDNDIALDGYLSPEGFTFFSK